MRFSLFFLYNKNCRTCLSAPSWESLLWYSVSVSVLPQSYSGIVQHMRNLLKGVAATTSSIVVLHSRRHECHVLLFLWGAIVCLPQTAVWWDGTAWWLWSPAIKADRIKLLLTGLAREWSFVLWKDSPDQQHLSIVFSLWPCCLEFTPLHLRATAQVQGKRKLMQYVNPKHTYKI